MIVPNVSRSYVKDFIQPNCVIFFKKNSVSFINIYEIKYGSFLNDPLNQVGDGLNITEYYATIQKNMA